MCAEPEGCKIQIVVSKGWIVKELLRGQSSRVGSQSTKADENAAIGTERASQSFAATGDLW
jgi:hypothetical protein